MAGFQGWIYEHQDVGWGRYGGFYSAGFMFLGGCGFSSACIERPAEEGRRSAFRDFRRRREILRIAKRHQNEVSLDEFFIVRAS